MMIQIEGDRLRLRLSPVERLLSGRIDSELSVPLDRIVGVSTGRPEPQRKILRLPGTRIPSLIKAGTYFVSGSKEFWYVTRDRDYLVILTAAENTLSGGDRFSRIVVTIKDSREIALAITERLK